MTHQTKEASIRPEDTIESHPVIKEFCKTTSLASVSIHLFKMYGMSMENPHSADLHPLERREMAEECIRIIEVVNVLEANQGPRKFISEMIEWKEQLEGR